MKRIKPEKAEKAAKKQKDNNKSKSLYEKYQCQYKKKPILTKLNNDSGYPQDLLHVKGDSFSHNNYVQSNKHNLKNFFKERIPPENNLVGALMKKQIELVHPKRIFEIKQMQFQLKNRTKMSLKNTFDLNLSSNVSTTFDKLDANFHVNDKNKQLKEKYGGGGRDSFVQYESENFRRGTQSHIEKRSKILKKQAYDKVFGPDISSMSRTNGFEKKAYAIDSPPPRAKSISLASPCNSKGNHKNLRGLIHKMHDYKNKLEQTDDVLNIEEADPENVGGEQNMITLIQNMTKLYQERSVQQGNQKIQSLEDIGKLNKGFYEEMLIHKNHRLAKRRQVAFQTMPLCPPQMDSNHSSAFQDITTQRIAPDCHSVISGKDSERQDKIEQEKTDLNRADFLNAVKFRFQMLKRTLVRWAALFYIYGINKNDIFTAFKVNKEPYAMEGAYAFFKYIKIGDLHSVNKFLENNRQFVFQVDSNGKTALAYAAYHNQTEIALTILKVGVNSDLKCYKGHTALYYALSKRNVPLVKALLQRGSCPWSNQKNPYWDMNKQEGQNSQELRNLFNNAKKIYVGMQLQPSIEKRKRFWDTAAHKIVEDEAITYG